MFPRTATNRKHNKTRHVYLTLWLSVDSAELSLYSADCRGNYSATTNIRYSEEGPGRAAGGPVTAHPSAASVRTTAAVQWSVALRPIKGLTAAE